jgi:type IV pilus assembly protein PilC
MAEFVFEARARTGELVKGTMEADNAETVQGRLRAQQLNPTRVKKKATEYNIPLFKPVPDTQLVVFTRQFATMIDAGLPLVQCLEILAAQSPNKTFGRILRDIKGSVEGGSSFSDALRKHPRVFDDLYVNLVQAGETGGILDTILQRLAVYIEKRVKLRRQVVRAMVYPSAILVVAALVVTILLTWVIPSFQEMFVDMGAGDELPALTQFVIDISDFMVGNIIFIAIAAIAAFAGIVYSYTTKGGRWFWHGLILSAPILGTTMRKIAVARFTRTLGTLLASGVPILDAMSIVGKAAGNVRIEAALKEVADKVREGRTMADPLMATKAFPPMVVQMIGVGEQTGALDQMLNKIADFYEEEVDVAVAALTSLLEPVMMVVIGGIVGFILIAMYLPIFDLAGKVSGH